MTNPPLPVLFRKSGEDVIAVFPTLPADYTGNTMVCYMHVGQHGACSIGFYLDSKPAYPHEYDDLLQELKGIYEKDLGGEGVWPLKVCRKRTAQHRAEFLVELRKIKEGITQ